MVALVLFWWLLTEGENSPWFFGSILICATTLFVLLSSRQTLNSNKALPENSPRLVNIFLFIPYFLFQSFRAGLETAVLAFTKTDSLKPGFVRYTPRFLNGTRGRAFFMNLISLFPGSVSINETDGKILIHFLHRGNFKFEDLVLLEKKIAHMFQVQSVKKYELTQDK